MCILDNAAAKAFVNMIFTHARVLLDDLLIEDMVGGILEKAGLIEDPCDDKYEVDEIKMLSNIPNDPLLNLKRCSLNE